MVEHGTENAGVDSSSLSLGTTPIISAPDYLHRVIRPGIPAFAGLPETKLPHIRQLGLPALLKPPNEALLPELGHHLLGEKLH